MNSAIEHLNAWGAPFPSLAGTLLWQSTLLGLVILALDLGLRRRVRAAVRYALWLVLLVKLILPPSLALPTSPAWWWSRAVAPIPASTPQYQFTTVVNSPAELPPSETAFSPLPLAPLPPPPPPALTLAAWSLLAAGGGSLALLGWLILRWRQVVRTARAADEDPAYAPLLAEACQRTHCQSRVRVKITRATLSPAVCGLWRPVILLPQSLTETLAPEQLRAVLMHELMHVRRGDVWVNFAQALLQIIYWWHPLVWVANARIRRLREEAVDDAVMAALRDEADIYAPTLLAVAKFALQRPLASLGLVGILESRSALRQRIERLVIDPAPRRAGLSLAATFGLLVFSAVAVPMGDAPPLAPDNPANPSASTFTSNDQPDAPSNQVQQLVTFQLRPNSGLRKFRQQTGLTADSTADEYLAALSQRLAKAGIALPPERMLWLGDCGLLLVRGTAAELGAVDLLALDLNGFPTNNFHNPYSEVFAHGEAAPVETTNLFNRTFRLNTNTFYAAMQKIVGPVTTNDTQNVSQQLRTLFGRVGVNLQPPKAIFCNPRLRLIFVRATAKDLNAIEWVVEALNQPTWTTAADLVPEPNSRTASRDPEQSPGSIPQAMPNTSNPSSWVPALIVENGAGSYSPGTPVPPNSKVRVFKLDKAPGLLKFRQQTGLTADSTPDEYLAAFSKRLAKAGTVLPAERMIWLSDRGLLLVRGTAAELGAVHLMMVDLNGFPTNNFHNPYSKIFAHGGAAPDGATNLFDRTFKLNTKAFFAGIQAAIGPPATDEPQNLSKQMHALFDRMGVNLQPPKATFFNDGLGLLFVRATQDDLDTIESALETLNQPQPQIHIKARFLEVTGDPGAIPALTNYLDGQTRVSILAPGSARPWLHQLEQKPGSERLGEPEVTTLGGRQTEMRATQIQTVLTGINPKALTPPGLTGIEATNSAGLTNGTSLMCGTVVEFGPIFDVVPYVLADDHTVNLTVIAREDEFAGYDTPTNSVTVYVDGRPWKNRVPEVRPHFNLRELVTTQNLYDGQTLVLSQPVDPRTGQPVEHDGKNQKHLLVLATVSILDSAGNRIHPDETMPFTRDQVPPQPPKISSPAGPRKPFGSSPAFHLPEPPPSATGPDPVLDDRPFDKENQPLGF